MPNRILKESICVSDSINQLKWFEEVLFYRLIVNCDDYGRYDGRPAIIKNKLFPLKDDLTLKVVTDAINKLASAGLVILYKYEDKPFLYLPTWELHQTIRAKKSKFPPPEENLQASEIICKQMHADASKCKQMHANVPVIQSESESESYSESYSEEAHASKRFSEPTVEEVSAYCRERGNNIDPQRFVDYYTSNGWMVGKNKMKDWRAAVRNWVRRSKEISNSNNNQHGTEREQYTNQLEQSIYNDIKSIE